MMLTKRNTILASTCVLFSLVGPLIFWLSHHGTAGPSLANMGSLWSFDRNRNIRKQVSLGDKVLVTLDTNPDKQAGVKLFKAGKFADAIPKFNASLQLNRNDPETWIYLNNAIAAVSQNYVRVAVSVPIGGNVNVAKEILRGVAQYQHEVNHGSRIQGKLLQVELANDENDPDLAKQLATEFVQDKTIMAVIGHQSSDVSIAAAPIYEQGRVPMISPTSYARSLSNIGNYIFRTTPNSRAVADALAGYVVKSTHNIKVAICSDSRSQASRSFQEDFTAALAAAGGQITRTPCDFSAPDFNPQEITSKAISDGANSLLLSPAVESLRRAIEVVQANRGRLKLLASHTMYTYETLQQGLANANGMTLAVPWDPALARGSSYYRAAQNFWGGPGSWRTAMAYDATKVVAVGLSAGVSRENLQKTLSDSGFSVNGSTGVIQFLPTGDRNKPGTLVRILPGKTSGTGYDFVTLKP